MYPNFHKLFNTHSIYVTIDDKIYLLNKNELSRELVTEIPKPTRENPIVVIHKIQFDLAKNYLMDINNPFRMTIDIAEDYFKIGFITEAEFLEYKHKLDDELFNRVSD